jgi:putative nucleotidyltransferase with HDIG domain
LDKSENFLSAKKTFTEITETDISDGQFLALARTGFHDRVEKILAHLLADVNLNLIVSNRELLKNEIGKGITLNRIDSGVESRTELAFHNIGAIIDVEAARTDLESKAKAFFDSPQNQAFAAQAEKIIALAKRFVVPNLTLNRQETERRRNAVIDEIKPVLVKINKGESIVKYQETINKRHLAILKQMEKNSQNDNSRFQFFFTTIFLALVMYALVAFLSGGMMAFKLTWQDFLALAVLMVATILLIKGLQFIVAEALLERIPQLPFDFYYYLVPVAAGPVIVRMLMDKQPALIFSVVLSIVGGILLERNFFYAAYILSSSLIASQLAHTIKTRSVIYRAGFFTGIANVAMITCIIANTRNAASLNMLWQDIGWIAWAGLLSGLFMSMIVVSLVPLVELISGRTSDLRLLELANMNHPLLRDLMVKAPGTYHHCIVIGSLVEAAAEAIGANPLMARVMAYYHDVGKTERPLYFIENQGGGYNRHDGLQPHMSAMIIREHVKRGQELGKKFKLPQPLIDAMSEHHGSSTIAYFYNKARSQAEDPEALTAKWCG